ncbi:MAG TPA: hypothetical protein DD435_03835 [Cyanobacteria bacterium UBA8530]|nr:hypothetical protein [Cyanobacteria bacterium UBA8530]
MNNFYIVDVFAERPFTGNQLAVLRRGNRFSTETMPQMARETNFSDTAFIMSDEATPEGYEVRIFTPEEELPFAGHPSLGTARVIQQELIRTPVEKLSLRLVGTIPISIQYRHPRSFRGRHRGIANGCRAAYLLKHRLSHKGEHRSEQGYEIGRPSLLTSRALEKGGEIRVSVGGRVIPIVKGKLFFRDRQEMT